MWYLAASATTDAAGAFVLPCALPEGIAIDVAADGHRSRTLSPVNAGQPLVVDLAESGFIDGRLLDARRAPIAGTVLVAYEVGAWDQVEADRDVVRAHGLDHVVDLLRPLVCCREGAVRVRVLLPLAERAPFFAELPVHELDVLAVVAGLAAHGVMDLFHGRLVDNPGVPPFWPGFCSAYDVAAAGYLAWRIASGRVPSRP